MPKKSKIQTDGFCGCGWVRCSTSWITPCPYVHFAQDWRASGCSHVTGRLGTTHLTLGVTCPGMTQQRQLCIHGRRLSKLNDSSNKLLFANTNKFQSEHDWLFLWKLNNQKGILTAIFLPRSISLGSQKLRARDHGPASAHTSPRQRTERFTSHRRQTVRKAEQPLTSAARLEAKSTFLFPTTSSTTEEDTTPC